MPYVQLRILWATQDFFKTLFNLTTPKSTYGISMNLTSILFYTYFPGYILKLLSCDPTTINLAVSWSINSHHSKSLCISCFKIATPATYMGKFLLGVRWGRYSVFWISLRHTLPNPKKEKLTPILLLLFTKKS